ncbi:Phosphoenolpyruvate carboxylase kinase 2 [Senna tora]|uniref:Phosphoenolpyruvate carboxylase kinase 2 n=1 Tax=Senna tora TaxID=362788 RepID=A0A835CII3_9FABA|nr:Phosphoenolpyruvate carboxylase kinase 2 [Senna tora]
MTTMDNRSSFLKTSKIWRILGCGESKAMYLGSLWRHSRSMESARRRLSMTLQAKNSLERGSKQWKTREEDA